MLYRKYRPQTFGQVVGQEHVVKTLRGALTTGRTGHAYLFCGPRGTGKTTIARLLAKSLNCANFSKIFDGNFNEKLSIRRSLAVPSETLSEGWGEGGFDVPCNQCDQCLAVNQNRSLDLIEIDAASNRGIDEIRSLKESALVSAPSGGYKVFIIDEVHMLTKDAFNALLKILEEPPSHVVFILATTEPHKILPTVLSRVQRFDFRRITPVQIVGKLEQMAKSEKIDIDKEGLMAIAVSADGGLRDAEVSLSKVMASHDNRKEISVDDVYSSLGLIPLNYYPELLGYIVSNDKNSALDLINRAYAGGVDLEHLASGFVDYLRKVLMHTINPAILTSVGEELLDNDIKLISTYSQALTSQQIILMLNVFVSAKEGMKSSPIPQLPLELAILELISS